MKMKLDFVSNSSSCSFVMYGFNIPWDSYDDSESVLRKIIEIATGKILAEDDDFYDVIDALPFTIGMGSEGGACDDNHIIIGRDVATFDECCEYMELPMVPSDDLIELAQKFGLTKESVKIIVGTRAC